MLGLLVGIMLLVASTVWFITRWCRCIDAACDKFAIPARKALEIARGSGRNAVIHFGYMPDYVASAGRFDFAFVKGWYWVWGGILSLCAFGAKWTVALAGALMFLGVIAIGVLTGGSHGNNSLYANHQPPGSTAQLRVTGDHFVTGYQRDDGTSVPGHWRTNPDASLDNNYGSANREAVWKLNHPDSAK